MPSDITTMPEIIEGAELAPLTTVKLGGKARWLAVCRSTEQLREAVKFALDKGVRFHVLGGGSNTIFVDEGFDGVVIKVDLKGIEFAAEGEGVLVKAAAGEDWDEFVAVTVDRGLSGVECLSGIPGTVGAAPVQNIGAYGQSVSDAIKSVGVLNLNTLEEELLSNFECSFEYRTSLFKKEGKGKFIITGVVFELTKGGVAEVKYSELAQKVEEMGGNGGGTDPSVVRKAVLELRARKGMVEKSGLNTCGSFFMNVVMSKEELEAAQKRFKESGGSGQIPFHEDGAGKYKVSAAWLIEQAGFKKGHRKGGVGLSPYHALALVSYEGSTQELLEFAEEVAGVVKGKFGIELKREPVLVRN